MIERCAYCGLEHDVGDGSIRQNGVVIKTCPMLPPNLFISTNDPPVDYCSEQLADDLNFFDTNDVIDA